MKKLLIVGILVALLFVAMPAMAHILPLYANENEQVGTVEIQYNYAHGIVFVNYSLDAGWFMTESHVAYNDSVDHIPQTKTHNPIPGHFGYSMVHDPPVDEYSYSIYDPAPPFTPGYLAIQADVIHVTDEEIDGSASAWAAETLGTRPFSGKNWATYIRWYWS